MNRHPLVLSCLGLLILGSCKKEEAPAEAPLRPVRTLTLQSPAGGRERVFAGTSKAAQEARLSFKVAGTVIDLPVAAGDRLRRGQLIARLDPKPFELEAQQAQASLVQAEANERNADASYQRVKGLYENNNASRTDLDAARAQAESARAQVRAARKAVELARLSVSYTRLRVDTDCSVAEVAVELNENVASGTPIAVVNCGESFEVVTSVPETLISKLAQGMTTRLRFGALPDRSFEGTVTEIGSASSRAATFPVTVQVEGDRSGLRSGLAAEVIFTFHGGADDTAHFVPGSSVLNDQDGTWVFIAEPGSGGEATVRRRAVTVGELTERGLQVLSGVEQGDRVITAGASSIRDGQRVLLHD
ncbi:MAG: efflux RND transporter periplasmic adaptor subunit [Acidobacteriota bacterium]